MAVKDTVFCVKKLLNCGGNLLTSEVPLVMGIVNITPDSFFDGGKYLTENLLIRHAEKLLAEGADILDLGACSTRPGAEEISLSEEINRLIPAIHLIKKHFPDVIVSADTYRASVAEAAVGAGAAIINDISGGTLDPAMFDMVARLKVPYILMHIKGNPKTMQENPVYENIVNEVLNYFIEKTENLKSLGVKDIIIDPGFGFGKQLEHNYQLLSGWDVLKMLGYPILAGISRKSMINKVLKTTPEHALNGTTVLNTLLLQKGVSILRVHDVKEAKEAVKLVTYLKSVEEK